jgi:transposase-like protein
MDFVERSIRDVEARGLRARTVILAPFSRDLATGLLRLTSPHVVWLDEVTRDLKSVLHHMVESDLRFVICQALLRTCGSDPLLERAVRQAFTGSDCPTTVSELASRAHCTPSTLRAHWRRSDFPDSPQALVEWAVLAALAELREEGSKISAVSRIVGLHETTLYRAARRRIGVSPTGVGRSALLGAIDDWLPARAG